MSKDNLINMHQNDTTRFRPQLQSSDFENINPEAFSDDPDRFINRELSWLAFNQRVIEEAQNEGHPLLERLRFVSIAAQNLEEFFMVRVAGLKVQIDRGIATRSIDGLTAQQQLEAINYETAHIVQSLQNTWQQVRAELKKQDIEIVNPKSLTKQEKKWVRTLFENEVFPVLSPIAVDTSHPFPFIPNKGLAVAFLVQDKERKEQGEAIIRIPEHFDRLFALPGTKDRYILIEDMIIMFADSMLFPDPIKVKEHAVFRILRDSEIEIEEEAEDLTRTFETALKRRRRGNVIQMTVNRDPESEIIDFLSYHLQVNPFDIIAVDGMIGLGDTAGMITDHHRDLLFDPFNARFPERIRDFGGDCFAAIQQKDIVIHHPFESFDVVVQLLRQAARDPNVIAIKQTLYRTSEDSPIVAALIEAAEAGKSVTALVELKARFDEEANIRWAKDMERAGVQVVYGFLDLKTHAKVSLILRREGRHLRSYAHFGTGNYHPVTAKIYTDLSYFTCDKDLCHDTTLLFNYMTGYAKPVAMKSLCIAPMNLRDKIIEQIDNEIKLAQKGKPASIWFKCNALLDSGIIDKLYEASQAGVEIELIVRGICSLRPGIKGFSENIRVKSVIGRFLEHSRIYCFGNGKAMPSRSAKVFIASADMMKRNLDRRIEALIPIKNKTVHKQILDQIMMAYLKDSKQSWELHPAGEYTRLAYKEDGFCAHEYFMTNPSLSGRGKALDAAPMLPRLSLNDHKAVKEKNTQSAAAVKQQTKHTGQE